MKSSETEQVNRWDRFWFQPQSLRSFAPLRGGLCLIALLYFLSAWSDATDWYAGSGTFSPQNTARIWQAAGSEGQVEFSLSPLFLTNAGWAYQAYLGLGILAAIAVMLGRGGRIAPWLLWGLLVGWANRAMTLAGLTETLLSLALFAAAIAPPASCWNLAKHADQTHWSTRLAHRLLAVQITVVGLATLATMLAGQVWFNGLGAYALAAPSSDRTIDWTDTNTTIGAWFDRPTIYETVTHLMVVALPLGLWLAWRPATRGYGRAMLWCWCGTIALLGSLWLYAATFAVMVAAIGSADQVETEASATER
ncbi:MAG: hypothetical protein MI861_06110 [Pirellulales bacterium]|nr:hypothetical protein [Pirellulales bacterium]